MSDLNGAVGYARRWIELHRENKFQREAAKIMQRVVDALVSVRAERDAALARIAELEKSRDRWEELCGKIASEKYDLNARIAEAAKLHRKRDDLEYRWGGGPVCDGCGDEDGWASKWPCPTAVALGLNEGERDDY